MSEVIRWENPPEHANKRPARAPKYQKAADALRARPGEWAVIAEKRTTGSAGGLSHNIRNGRNPWLPAGAWEARVVGPAGGLGTVYARYVGEAGSEATPKDSSDLGGDR